MDRRTFRFLASVCALICCLSSCLLSNPACAQYYRFWRGFIKPGITAQDFEAGLNQVFLPATGALAHGPAHLVSYQPVLLPLQTQGPHGELPTEVALVGYENEAAYQAFRATPEGKHYGNMHWDYFDSSTSSSRVPVPYVGEIAADQAYDVVGGEPDWYSGQVRFRWILRQPAEDSATWLARVKVRVERIRALAPKAFVVLVEGDYTLEYLQGDDGEEGGLSLPVSGQIHYGSGLRFPL